MHMHTRLLCNYKGYLLIYLLTYFLTFLLTEADSIENKTDSDTFQ